MEKIDLVFLAKLQNVINELDDLDNLCDNYSTQQSNIDYELSDYLHLIQHHDIPTDKLLEIDKKIKELRILRESYQNLSKLIYTFNQNKNKLVNESNRKFLLTEIQKTLKNLNQPYNYRILNNVDYYLTDTCEKKKKEEPLFTKEQLEELLKTKKSKEIAEEYNISQASLSQLKRTLGVEVRGYKKKGD